MKPTTKIRFTEPQIALLMCAHPNCNLDHLTELSFEFDQAGKVIDCTGTIKTGGNIARLCPQRAHLPIREPSIDGSTSRRNDIAAHYLRRVRIETLICYVRLEGRQEESVGFVFQLPLLAKQ